MGHLAGDPYNVRKRKKQKRESEQFEKNMFGCLGLPFIPIYLIFRSLLGGKKKKGRKR